ncbi:MAG: bis(5'-nucleosyl)-tetraphosphatase (symmetrical) YqeK [Coriobacteriia bacterium]|nr:bis(5'-nucleosyl)-tetraphosphatase (symmetrical) YqeK [Coriobacteriia bacterium]
MALSTKQEAYIHTIKEALLGRLSQKRLLHVYEVENLAIELAKRYGIDEFNARAAALLHDWDKELGTEELLELANIYELEIDGDPSNIYPLLHAWTGAFSAMLAFPDFDNEVYLAIYNHTLACKDMSDLDKLIYCADMLEPSRGIEDLDKLLKKSKRMSLDELYVHCYAHTMASLIERRLYIYPPALDIWNDLIEKHPKIRRPRRKSARVARRTGDDNPATKAAKKKKAKKKNK